MNVVILDPGYEHIHGHHHIVNCEIHKFLSKKGFLVKVISGRSIDHETMKRSLNYGMNIIPYFHTPCYPPNVDRLLDDEHELISNLFASEIIKLYEMGLLMDADYLLMHTIYSCHIVGFAKAILKIKKFQKDTKLIISLMFNPGAKLTGPDYKRLKFLNHKEYLRYKLGLSLLDYASAKAEIEIILATSCRSYQRIYEYILKKRTVNIHPSVTYRPLDIDVFPTSNRKRVLLYLGCPKSEKGILFSAKFGAALASLYPNVEFIFHYNDLFPGAESFKTAVDELLQSGTIHKNVSLIKGYIDEKKYDELIKSSEIFCLLYDPKYYEFKTSGIFWDMLRKEKCKFLVTENTWISEEIKELNIPHETIRYDDMTECKSKLDKLLSYEETGLNKSNSVYYNLLNNSFAEWLYKEFIKIKSFRNYTSASYVNPDFKSNRGRILIIRTQYEHFSPFSGPGGFIPYLRGFGYEVDELLVPLGNQNIQHVTGKLLEEFKFYTDKWLLSYQGNSIIAETQIQRQIENYDIIHFLDAEHCGLLSSLLKLQTQIPFNKFLVATFHQPPSVLKDLIINPYFLRGFDKIHLLAPNQIQFFNSYINPEKLIVIPHGVAPEIFENKLPAYLVGVDVDADIKQLSSMKNEKKSIILTVGKWLRDFEMLREVAKILQKNSDLLFVIVSHGLKSNDLELPNIILLNEGISDSQLHSLYQEASLLFLPLKDSAANNAILEAMAHGLPIVTTDLPATRYYTDNSAIFCENNAQAYVKAIEDLLFALKNPVNKNKISSKLRKKAESLVWKKIAIQMHENLYQTLVNYHGR